MRTGRLITAAVALVLPMAACENAFDSTTQHALTYTASKVNATHGHIREGSYPKLTDPSGAWVTYGPSEWTSAFLPGALWRLYQGLGDTSWRDKAIQRQAALESQ